MTKEEALQMCLEYIETNAHERRLVRWAIKDALAQPEERNFCQRCGKRTADLTTIHTCTPPQSQWVNLTVDELIDLEHKHLRHEDLVQAIKAKLKEKNT
jgi:hypothetical protein